jgi:hypothetical protein
MFPIPTAAARYLATTVYLYHTPQGYLPIVGKTRARDDLGLLPFCVTCRRGKPDHSTGGKLCRNDNSCVYPVICYLDGSLDLDSASEDEILQTYLRFEATYVGKTKRYHSSYGESTRPHPSLTFNLIAGQWREKNPPDALWDYSLLGYSVRGGAV